MNDPRESHTRMATAMAVAAAVLAIVLFSVLFQDAIDDKLNPNQRVEIVDDGAGGTIRLRRNSAGHYVATGAINGVRVEFLLDTGATDVSIPARVAQRIGLEGGRPVPVSTANGTVTVFQTRLDSVALGNLAQRDVEANINPHMDGKAVLLGMSFLQHLELRQRGDYLELRPPAG